MSSPTLVKLEKGLRCILLFVPHFRCTEIAWMLIIGIDDDAFEYDFRVSHKDFQRMHTRFFHIQFYGESTLVIEYFSTASLSFPDKFDACVLLRQRFQIG